MKLRLLVSFLGLAACGGQTAATDSSSQAAQADTVATASDAGRPPMRPHGPPPEALAACTGKAAGDACSVTLRDETLTGKCAAPPFDAGAGLACRPDRMPEHGHGPGGHPHGPPPDGPPPDGAPHP